MISGMWDGAPPWALNWGESAWYSLSLSLSTPPATLKNGFLIPVHFNFTEYRNSCLFEVSHLVIVDTYFVPQPMVGLRKYILGLWEKRVPGSCSGAVIFMFGEITLVHRVVQTFYNLSEFGVFVLLALYIPLGTTCITVYCRQILMAIVTLFFKGTNFFLGS